MPIVPAHEFAQQSQFGVHRVGRIEVHAERDRCVVEDHHEFTAVAEFTGRKGRCIEAAFGVEPPIALKDGFVSIHSGSL